MAHEEKIQETPEQCYRRLVDNHNETLAAVCRYIFPRNRDLRKALYSFLIVYLWDIHDKIPRDRNPQETKAWMFVVMYRTALNWVKREQRRLNRLVNVDLDSLPCPPDDGETARRRQYLDTLIDHLPQHDREVVLLYLLDTPLDEMACTLGRSKNAISIQLFRIKQQLIQLSKKIKYQEP